MIRSMEFVTLTTGSTTMARRADVTEDTMALARELLAGETSSMGWSASSASPAPEVHHYSIFWRGAPVAECLLCQSAALSGPLWETAEAMAPAQVVLHRPRGTPWVAVHLLPGSMMLHRDDLLALPWLEIAIAWSFIES